MNFDGNSIAMYLGLGLSLGSMVAMWVVRRTHYRCRFCGNLHRDRPKDMNALVFMMTICRRVEEIKQAKEMRWQHQ